MQIILTLDDVTYQYVSREAEVHNLPVEAMLSDKIRETYVPWYVTSNDPMDMEMAAYATMYPELVNLHLNQFVAITGGHLVDFDEDIDALETRLEQNYPGAVIYVTRVRPYIQPDLVIHSPHFIQDEE